MWTVWSKKSVNCYKYKMITYSSYNINWKHQSALLIYSGLWLTGIFLCPQLFCRMFNSTWLETFKLAYSNNQVPRLIFTMLFTHFCRKIHFHFSRIITQCMKLMLQTYDYSNCLNLFARLTVINCTLLIIMVINKYVL